MGTGDAARAATTLLAALLLSTAPASARSIDAQGWSSETAEPALRDDGRLSIAVPNVISTEIDTRMLRELSFKFEGECGLRAEPALDGEPVRSFSVPDRTTRKEVAARGDPGTHLVTLGLEPRSDCRRGRAVLVESSFREWVPIGSDFGSEYMTGDRPYRDLIADKADSVTAGTDMQFDVIEPSQGIFDFSGSDRVVEFAAAHDLPVRGHPLVWRYFLPKWVRNGNWTRDQAIEIMRNHIQTIIGHYRGRVAEWDVVNEAIDEAGRFRRTFWYSRIGPSYVELAFRFAREADPDARLYYNDFGTETDNVRSDAVLQLVRAALAAGVPIDGVGFQYHADTGSFPDSDEMVDNFGRFAELGIGIQITEADVPDYTDDPDAPHRVELQADAFRAAARACKREPACERFTMWGLTDRYSWLGTEHRPLPFDRHLDSKPAWDEITDLLRPRG